MFFGLLYELSGDRTPAAKRDMNRNCLTLLNV
jgi:hypothetical protein